MTYKEEYNVGDYIVDKYSFREYEIIYKHLPYKGLDALGLNFIYEEYSRYDIKDSSGEIIKECYLHNNNWEIK